MADIKSPKVLWFKGLLFLFLGLFSAVLLMIYTPDLTVGLLLCISVWAFCRAYYFAFYVIEHYVDSKFRFAGLIDFWQYAFKRRSNEDEK
jgi:hypothetical protein